MNMSVAKQNKNVTHDLNKYFSSISKLDEENVTLPQFDSKTNNIIHEIHEQRTKLLILFKFLTQTKQQDQTK